MVVKIFCRLHPSSLAFSAAMLLGACNSSGSDQTAAVNAAAPSNIVPVASYLVTLAPGEKAVEPLTLGDDTPAPAITRFVLGTDIGFAATAGFNSNASVRSVAGLLASTDIVDPPSQGSASYEGVYNIIEVRNVEVRADGTSSISPRLLGGRAVIDVDFDKNTLLGYSDGSPILQVKGT
ncbi:MAG TPA: hypothetical protein ENK83_00965, partial [Aliiroseovarius sp.]|nr:hypothetical protein [Aliiroseovarius sp.]